MKKNFLSFCVTLFTTSLFSVCEASAQSMSEGDAMFVPEASYLLPSPVSQAYQRFSGFRPDLSSGAVNVTIPLFTLDYDDFSLPFSLNYQSNGIKPDDTYFPLGYGWVLHPGLRITRTVMGKLDETAPDKSSLGNPEQDACFFRQLLTSGPQQDAMYDVFTLSLPQSRASFLVMGTDASGSGWSAFTACDKYRIEPLKSSGITYFHGFKVTDENGIVYHFGEESAYSATSGYIETSRQGGSYVPTTYLLKKVVLPGDKEISFQWKKGGSLTSRFDSYYALADGYMRFFHSDGAQDSAAPEDQELSYATDGPAVMGSSLASVSLPDAEVTFSYAGLNLSTVYVTDKQGKTVHSARFEISDKLLQSVTLGSVEKYSFSYNPQQIECVQDQDFWGYYNGAGNDAYRCYPSFSYNKLVAVGPSLRRSTAVTSVHGANRQPNARYMQACILERVGYPTGGYTAFEYEPNRYKKPGGGIVIGGGLRVKRVTSGTGDGEEDVRLVKNYVYGEDGCGYGACSVHLDEKAFVSEMVHYVTNSKRSYAYRMLTLASGHQYSGYLQFNLPVWYRTVAEILPDGSKTVYEYDYSPDALREDCRGISSSLIPHDFSIYPMDYCLEAPCEYYHLFDRTPRLRAQKAYDSKGVLKRQETFEYQACKTSPANLNGINFRQFFVQHDYENTFCSPYVQYSYVVANIRAEMYFPCRYTMVQDGVTVIREFLYNAQGMPVRTTISHSDGSVVEEKRLYMDDDLSGVTGGGMSKVALQGGNRNALPVQIEKSVDGEVVARKSICYGASSGYDNEYVYPLDEYYDMNGQGEEKRVEYFYGNSAKPVEVSVDGKHTVWLWGYLGQYPVARIENAAYSEVAACVGESVLKAIAESNVLSASQRAALDALRVCLPHALVATYTYRPPYGVASETDAAGRTLYYTYDSAGRLTEKYRMAEGSSGTPVKELIESYEYKYKEE